MAREYTSKDLYFMRRALAIARRGFPYTFPNPLVGAVVVKRGKIIAEGFHKGWGFPHAEAEAFKASRENLRGCALYVNLEPCVHFGKTPPCAPRIVEEGIKKVFVSCLDPNPQVYSKGVRFLRERGVEVKVGLLRREALKLNEVYFLSLKKKRPFVVLKIAQTLDGRIATSWGESKWITSSHSRSFNRRQRRFFQAILVGINTVLKDNPRLCPDSPPYPKKIIVDADLRVRPHLNIFKSPGEVWVFASSRKKSLRSAVRGAQVFFVKEERRGMLDLKEILRVLFQRGIVYLLVEGGSGIFSSFFDKGFVDKAIFYLAPSLMLSRNSLSSINVDKDLPLSRIPVLREVEARRLGPDLRVEGYVKFK